jgi:hypothetical protein
MFWNAQGMTRLSRRKSGRSRDNRLNFLLNRIAPLAARFVGFVPLGVKPVFGSVGGDWR